MLLRHLDLFLSMGLGALAILALVRILTVKVVLHPYEAGLLYRRGRFVKRLDAGSYRLFRARSEIRVIDLRRATAQIAGQEVLSADGVSFKVSAAVEYAVESPEAAVHSVVAYEQSLYLAAQLAIRSAVAAIPIEEMLARKAEIEAEMLARVRAEADSFGVRVDAARIRDLMLSADLRRAFAETLRAKREGLAALEKARGEQAALRSLANAAQLLEKSPALLNLRWLQTAADVGRSTSNTLVLGVTPEMLRLTNGKGET